MAVADITKITAAHQQAVSRSTQPAENACFGPCRRNKRKEPLLSGASCIQTDASDSQFHTLSKAPLKRRNMNKKKRSQRASHHWASPVVCGVLFRLDRVLRCSDWALARHLFIFLSLFSLYSFSLSQLSLNRGQGPLGPALYCATGKLPIRAPLWLNTESRSFIKKLICYSLPLTHCFSFSHSLPFFFFFHWFTVPHSSFFSWTFLKLSLCCVHSLLLRCNPLPSRGLPWWGEDIMRLSSFSQYYGGDSNVTANTVIIARFTKGLALPGSIIKLRLGCAWQVHVCCRINASIFQMKSLRVQRNHNKRFYWKKLQIWLPKWGLTVMINDPPDNWMKVYYLCNKIQSRIYKLFTTYPIITWHARTNVS